MGVFILKVIRKVPTTLSFNAASNVLYGNQQTPSQVLNRLCLALDDDNRLRTLITRRLRILRLAI